MAFQMRFAFLCVDSQCAVQAGRQSTSIRRSFYETFAFSLGHRTACRLRPKPDGTLDAIGRAVESFGGAR
jgi:hypothetical protein